MPEPVFILEMGQDIRKILVIKLREMGDTIMATASLEALKKYFPEAEIHFACTDSWASLLEVHPFIDRIWPLNRKQKIKLYQSIFPLRRQNFDLVINLHASPSSARLAWWVAPRKKIIYSQGIQKLNHWSNVDWPESGNLLNAIERDLAPLKGLIPDLNQPVSTFLEVPSEKKRSFAQALKAAAPPRLILGIGASRRTKQWPASRYGELALRWLQESKGSVHIPYLSEEQAYIDQMQITKPSRGIHFHKNLSLQNLAALMANGDYFCGNDSGPKHMAISLGLPSVTIFGPEDPYVWHPYDQKKHPLVFIKDLPCRPQREGMARCSIPLCTVEKHRCMQEISLEDVWEKLSQLAAL